MITTHPDYMNFDGHGNNIEEYPIAYYIEFLNYVRERYSGQYYACFTKEINTFL